MPGTEHDDGLFSSTFRRPLKDVIALFKSKCDFKTVTKLKRTFTHFDKNKTGKIPTEDLRLVLLLSEIKFPKSDTAILREAFLSDGGSSVNYGELLERIGGSAQRSSMPDRSIIQQSRIHTARSDTQRRLSAPVLSETSSMTPTIRAVGVSRPSTVQKSPQRRGEIVQKKVSDGTELSVRDSRQTTRAKHLWMAIPSVEQIVEEKLRDPVTGVELKKTVSKTIPLEGMKRPRDRCTPGKGPMITSVNELEKALQNKIIMQTTKRLNRQRHVQKMFEQVKQANNLAPVQFLNLHEFKHLLRHEGFRVSDNLCREFFDRLDLDRDSLVSVDEFVISLNQGMVDFVPPERVIARDTRARIIRATSTGSVSALSRTSYLNHAAHSDLVHAPLTDRKHCDKHNHILDKFSREMTRGRYSNGDKFNFERDEFLMPVDEVLGSLRFKLERHEVSEFSDDENDEDRLSENVYRKLESGFKFMDKGRKGLIPTTDFRLALLLSYPELVDGDTMSSMLRVLSAYFSPDSGRSFNYARFLNELFGRTPLTHQSALDDNRGGVSAKVGETGETDKVVETMTEDDPDLQEAMEKLLKQPPPKDKPASASSCSICRYQAGKEAEDASAKLDSAVCSCSTPIMSSRASTSRVSSRSHTGSGRAVYTPLYTPLSHARGAGTANIPGSNLRPIAEVSPGVTEERV